MKLVGFKKIDLAMVKLPLKEHLVVHRAPCVLPLAIARLQDTDLPARKGLRGLLKYALKWLEGDIFVLRRLDAGDENEADAAWAEAFLRGIEAECTNRA